MILIVGSGGNGQSYFMNFIRKNNIKINNKNDYDRLKHISKPNMNKLKHITKCIFLYNEPCKSILSHFRRKWQFIQLEKLGNPFNLKAENVKNLNIFFYLTKKHKKDIFGIKYQFDNWINSNLHFPIYFLNFNDILYNKKTLDNFIGKKLNYDFLNLKREEIINII